MTGAEKQRAALIARYRAAYKRANGVDIAVFRRGSWYRVGSATAATPMTRDQLERAAERLEARPPFDERGS